MSLSKRINDTNCAPWVIEEIRKLEAELDAFSVHAERLRKTGNRVIQYGCDESEWYDVVVAYLNSDIAPKERFDD